MKLKYSNALLLFILCFTATSFGQLIVKDQETPRNTLLQINDEGSAGSITIPAVSTGLAGNKLYNYGGNLYWGSNQLGLAGTSGWTRNAGHIYPTNLTDFVGIGTNSPAKNLHVKGGLEIMRLESSIADGWLSINNTVNGISAYKGYLGMYNGDNDIDIGTGQGNSSGNLNLVTQAIPRVVISSTGDVDIKSGELNRSGKTGTANLVPIAYGIIEWTGSIISGTGNFTATYNSTTKEYYITINNEYYDNTNYCTLTNSFVNIYCSYSRASNDGKLTVEIIDRTGSSSQQGRFYFVVYKL